MKIDEAVESLAKFFNDLIGELVPGAVLLIGLAVMHIGPAQISALSKTAESGVAIALLVAALFATGHALLAIYTMVNNLLKKLGIVKELDNENYKARKSFAFFQKVVGERLHADEKSPADLPVDLWDYRDLRSVALSVSLEASSVGRRFMFISQLCNGAGTALLLLAIDFLYCAIFLKTGLYAYAFALPVWLQLLLLTLTAWALFKRAAEFERRAMTSPFAIAVADVIFKKALDGTEE